MQKFIKSVLKEKVQEVKFSDRLVSSPAIVTSIITPHMRKMMKSLMAGKELRENDGFNNIPMTLELSPKHHIVTTLQVILESNEPVARIAVEQLYDNACIAAGTLDDPRVLMSRLNKVLEMFVYQGAGYDYAKGEYRSSEPKVEETAKTSKDRDLGGRSPQRSPDHAHHAVPEDTESSPESSSGSTGPSSNSSSKFEEDDLGDSPPSLLLRRDDITIMPERLDLEQKRFKEHAVACADVWNALACMCAAAGRPHEEVFGQPPMTASQIHSQAVWQALNQLADGSAGQSFPAVSVASSPFPLLWLPQWLAEEEITEILLEAKDRRHAFAQIASQL
eukprot:g14086.t1